MQRKIADLDHADFCECKFKQHVRAIDKRTGGRVGLKEKNLRKQWCRKSRLETKQGVRAYVADRGTVD